MCLIWLKTDFTCNEGLIPDEGTAKYSTPAWATDIASSRGLPVYC